MPFERVIKRNTNILVPECRINKNGGMTISKKVFTLLDEPTHLIFMVDTANKKLAFMPCKPTDDDAYQLKPTYQRANGESSSWKTTAKNVAMRMGLTEPVMIENIKLDINEDLYVGTYS